MKTIHSVFIITLSLLFSCLTLAAPQTHLGIAPYQHVTLSLNYDANSVCSNQRSFYRVLPNGSLETAPYKVPEGKYLIITDVVWMAVKSPTAFSPGRLVNMRLLLYKADGSYQGEIFHASPVFITSDHESVIGGGDHIIAGVRVGTWRLLCAYATSDSETGGAVNTIRTAWVHGYHVNK